jgi:hypothetical protein
MSIFLFVVSRRRYITPGFAYELNNQQRDLYAYVGQLYVALKLLTFGCEMDYRGVGVRVPVGSRASYSISSRPTLEPTQPSIYMLPRAKRQGREADDSPPTSAKVKKMRISTSTPRTPSWRS